MNTSSLQPVTRAAFALALVGLLAATVAGCDSLLKKDPPDEISNEQAITDAGGAEAALTGAYNALQSSAYYGGGQLFLLDVTTENTMHVGTYTSYANADQQRFETSNAVISDLFGALYDGINRTNNIIERVPQVEMDEAERARIVGEAHFLRALMYHDLVRLWGGVPVRLEATASADLGPVERDSRSAVYEQITSDLSMAADRLSAGGPSQAKRASLGAVRALEARVALYRENWSAAASAADAVLGMDYTLASDFGAIFDGEGTSEDLFKVDFNAQSINDLAYYYFPSSLGGRGELAPDTDLIDAFPAGDERGAWSIDSTGDGTPYGAKYRRTDGSEDVHVLRLAEMLLIKAEAHARQGELDAAVTAYNRLRTRAGLPEHTLGDDVSGQSEVLDAVWREWRLEMAFEGARWPNLVRTGRATDVLGLEDYKTRFPIPQREVELTDMEQNPGYN
ncbi:MAG: hypothetical protein BRD29_05105 [Bacteroidetes bacterium QH_2_67_10]|nr:MAG: hypothetical protein BRD29_05105 [Bacteroidetes bacterium QH_2_67_10]